MKLPPYVIFQAGEKEFILETIYPFYYGKIIRYEGTPLHDWSQLTNLGVMIAGYRIAIHLVGTFISNHQYIHVTNNTKRAILNIEMENMASWYLVEVIGK